jgi:hypothetical protein
MPTTLFSYRKTSDAHTTYELRMPDAQGDEGNIYCAELGTIDGLTYVSVPDGVTLPAQLPQVAATLQIVTLTPELRAQLKATSPHCALIAERMVQKIRARCSIDDEMFFARIGVGAAAGMYTPTPDELAEMQAFGVFVEGVRQWGRAERHKLGL